MRGTMCREQGCISTGDLELLQVTDDPEQAARFVMEGIEALLRRKAWLPATSCRKCRSRGWRTRKPAGLPASS